MHLNFEYSYANNLGSHKTHMLKVITIRGITLPRGNSLFFFLSAHTHTHIQMDNGNLH